MLKVRNEELCMHLYNVTSSAFEKINSIIREGKTYIPRYFNWPVMSKEFENGLPRFSEDSFSEKRPIDYKGFFEGQEKQPQVKITELDGYNEYEQYAMANTDLAKKYAPPSGDVNGKVFKVMIQLLFESLVERYFNLYGFNDTFDLEKFKYIYIPIENSIYDEELFIDIVVPLLFVKFDFDFLKLNDNTYIERMDEIMQLSRTGITEYSVPVNKTALNATTHALVLKKYSFKNDSYWNVFNLLKDERAYPLDVIDTFVNCIRIALNLETGYTQLIARPDEWCDSYKANLTPIYGTLVRAYPSKFDKYYWLSPNIPTIKQEQMQHIGEMFCKIQSEPSQKLKIANQRLKYCYLRDNEQDAVIDAMIALETLLTDDEKTELNHRISLRMAVLLPLSKEITHAPIEIFKTVKKIYDYRSAIVHGNPKADNKREIRLEGTSPVPVIEKAIEYLRLVISIMIENPQYLKASKIDEELLLNNSIK
ncbi:hypothetical protein C2H96_19510 [Bacillus subtilis]|uniref:HEPN domain-containing protein n=1 Tax=Bacillus subtilis TaxID=1423 RepID=UPI00201CB432|nr:HEPN domain-containing protein [Bacillus subtilis]UQZ56518.1 hypothetical protein C2H96_19510 [Bacillus subtilis]UQZ65106.1 hypothetical protein C2H97_00795 [Bacillus subtilis PY79]UQZ69530.1 hypothetical protein C2I05_02770 [Bacillus subtilis]